MKKSNAETNPLIPRPRESAFAAHRPQTPNRSRTKGPKWETTHPQHIKSPAPHDHRINHLDEPASRREANQIPGTKKSPHRAAKPYPPTPSNDPALQDPSTKEHGEGEEERRGVLTGAGRPAAAAIVGARHRSMDDGVVGFWRWSGRVRLRQDTVTVSGTASRPCNIYGGGHQTVRVPGNGTPPLEVRAVRDRFSRCPVHLSLPRPLTPWGHSKLGPRSSCRGRLNLSCDELRLVASLFRGGERERTGPAWWGPWSSSRGKRMGPHVSVSKSALGFFYWILIING
jgi:hypothetical protein